MHPPIGSAEYWATRLPVDRLRVNRSVLDRHAVAVEPEYAALVDRLAERVRGEAEAAKESRLAELERAHPGLAATKRLGCRTFVGQLGGALWAIAAFALYFSKADYDRRSVLPLAAVFLALAVLFLALGHLPWRRDEPPPFQAMVLTYLPAGLGAVTVGTVHRLHRDDPGARPWLLGATVAGLGLLVFAGRVAVGRWRTPTRTKRAEESVLTAYEAGVAQDAMASVSRAAAELRDAFDALPGASRTAIAGDLRAAYALLREQGHVVTAAGDHLPGVALLDDAVSRVVLGPVERHYVPLAPEARTVPGAPRPR